MILKNEMRETHLSEHTYHQPMIFQIRIHFRSNKSIILGLIFSNIKDTESRLKIHSL
jgi:hypothetical protein